MKANYTVLEGDLRVIRPLVYVREKELRRFAEKVKLPVIAENCPACFEAPKERHRTKQLLAAQEILFPDLYHSLLTAMKPLMARNRVGLESSKMKEGNYEDFLWPAERAGALVNNIGMLDPQMKPQFTQIVTLDSI